MKTRRQVRASIITHSSIVLAALGISCASEEPTAAETSASDEIAATERALTFGDSLQLPDQALRFEGLPWKKRSLGPTPIGCFKDQGDPQGTTGRDLSGFYYSDPAMTGQLCINTCSRLGYAYAGTQYATHCFCGDSYGASGAASNCDMPCGGSSTEMCGGAWANTVYEARPGQQASSTAILDYTDNLPRLALVQPAAGTAQAMVGLPEGISGTQVVGSSVVNNQAELALLKTFADVTWPGALVQGGSISNNDFAPILLPRARGRIRLATNFVGASTTSQYRDLPVVGAGEVEDATRSMLQTLAPSDSVATMSYAAESAETLREAMVKLGIAYKGDTASASLDAKLNASYSEKTIVVKFVQTFYTVAFDPDANSPSPFFAPLVSLDDVKRFSSASNPPLYVSQVAYGRMLLARFTARMSELELHATVKAAYQSFSGSLDASYTEKLKQTRIDLLSVGLNGEVITKPIQAPTPEATVDALRTVITSGSIYNYTTNPGAPIALSMRYVGSRAGQGPYAVAISQMTTQCSPQVVSLTTQRTCKGPFAVWDGTGGGWVDTAVEAYPGDKVELTASGTNWSGVAFSDAYGPNGWHTWDAPGDGGRGYPLTNRSPFALIARFGSRNNMGVDRTKPGYSASGGATASDSFFVGDSGEFIAGSADSQTGAGTPGYGRVFLGTNDNNPFNGDANRKFSVSVCFTRKVY